MSETAITRRLAAILAADVVGYSRMMAADEVGTLASLKAVWSDEFNPVVARYRGRIVKMMGDGALVEFASAVDAVECALAFQSAISSRSGSGAEAKPIAFRIGINLGDIVIDGGDIFGDGVNIAARLESHAPEGGVLVSDAVHAQVKGKVADTFSDAGELALKNIGQPVRAWRWGGDQSAAPRGQAYPSAPTEKPSIAVLPFTVMSSDPEQEFFADGLVEDLLTTLSKLSGLTVIARNSSFVYKGQVVDVRQVARELGVRYVLEGSVRKAGNRIRITAQLIDARDGSHVWAERFDRAIDDIFAVQDEITLTLATEMQVRFTEGEQARLRYTTTGNVEAWTLWIKGLNHYHGPVTAENQILAQQCWKKALELDPGSASLNAMVGFTHFAAARFGWWDDRGSEIRKAEACVERALAIDQENPDAHRTAAGILLLKSRFEEAVTMARKTIALSPNFPDGLMFAAFVMICSGHAEEAVGSIEKAFALSPSPPANYYGQLGNALRLAGRATEAAGAFREYHARSPGFGLADIVMIEEQAGNLEAARKTAAELLAARPGFTVGSWLRTQFRSDTEQLAADAASLRAARIPE